MFNTLIKNKFAKLAPDWVGFDLDGTIVNSLPDITLALNSMLGVLGRTSQPEEKVRNWIGNGVPMLVKRALSDNIVPNKNKYELLFADALALFMRAYRQHLCSESYLYPGALETLNKLGQTRISLTLITNKPIEFTIPLLEKLNIIDYFDLILGGDSLAEKKPSPLPLKHAANQLNLPLSNGLMIGDSSNDIYAAQRAGCPVVAVNYGYNHGLSIEELSPDLIVDNLTEIFG
ncbi:phosphoglycolate phosphatase [Aliikangiella sp. IMCC44359]|uniref:phosphoglycolate phosphatase n=1 Tax=Aliikangiella sp. IMCC44359 TaxID=3459125 RepID=UPI00403B2097